jgi:two-component system phosphate regulon sensor histidine kinase PhoR
MAIRHHIRPHLLIVSAALLILVPLLAYLQYHWLGQLSEEEHNRMRSNLQTAAFHFTRSYNEQLLLIVRTLGGDPRRGGAELSHLMASRVQEWNTQSTYPELLGGVFLVRAADGKRGVRVLEDGRFTSSQEPSDSLSTILWTEDPSLWMRIIVEQDYALFLRKDLQGFVLPLGGGTLPRPVTEYLYIQLNRRYMEEQYIPSIARMTLNVEGRQDYDYCVVSHDSTPGVLYSSLPGRRPIASGEADVREGLLMFPPGLITMGPPPRNGGPPAAGDRKPDEWRRFPGARANGDSTWFRYPGPRRDVGRDQWRGSPAYELRVRHRAGSLEIAVNQSRLRSLAISLGILLLMVCAVGVLLVSSYRAQHLAEQQIAFVAGVSHELRTPLAVLQSVGENLADGVVKDPPRVKSYGQLIRSEVQRLTVLVENALAYAGIHSGKQRYTLAPIGVADVITKAVSGCQAMMMEAGVRADVHMPDPSLMVKAEGGALVGALHNIITNAVKYRGQSQRIDITAGEVKSERGGSVRIAVRDYGLGIDARDISHIFEPFYRGTAARERQIHGNGLGLHLVRHVVQAHGGTVTVESKPAEGSVFVIQLPLYSPTQIPS